MIHFTDTHTHLDSESFREDQEAVIERAMQSGVTRLITIGASDGLDSAQRAITLAEKYPFIWCTVGVHPHDTEIELDGAALKELARHPKCVGIGETGLDFFRDWAPKERQQLWFEVQISIARELKKPLVIHSRNAALECLETLRRLNAEEVGGVFHCYSEDGAFAKELHEINFLVSFPGTVTFKKADTVRQAALDIPLSQIMLETDAPYMAPEPFRGKRCESSFLVHTAEKLAEVKGISLEELSRVTNENAWRLFGIGEV